MCNNTSSHVPANGPQEVCEAKLGQSRDRLREYSFEEVQAANAAGNCWLILSGASMCSLACASCPTLLGPYTVSNGNGMCQGSDTVPPCWGGQDSSVMQG